MTMYVSKNSDINTVILPYTSLSGSLEPHGKSTMSVNWFTLGMFPSSQPKTQPSCFCYFLWFAFFSQSLDFRALDHTLKSSNTGDVSVDIFNFRCWFG